MIKTHARLYVTLLVIAACQSSTPSAGGAGSVEVGAQVQVDPAIRAPLLEAVAALEGRWIATTPHGESVHVFHVSSGGSAVRELMSAGTEHEMTNMYTLDGNGIAMTHYCGAGNQPRMRAVSLDGQELTFESVSVGDLNDPNELYMGAMTLVFVDENNVEEHWTSVTGQKIEEMGVFKLRRAE